MAPKRVSSLQTDRAEGTELAGAVGAVQLEALERAREISRKARERARAWEQVDRLHGTARRESRGPRGQPPREG